MHARSGAIRRNASIPQRTAHPGPAYRNACTVAVARAPILISLPNCAVGALPPHTATHHRRLHSTASCLLPSRGRQLDLGDRIESHSSHAITSDELGLIGFKDDNHNEKRLLRCVPQKKLGAFLPPTNCYRVHLAPCQALLLYHSCATPLRLRALRQLLRLLRRRCFFAFRASRHFSQHDPAHHSSSNPRLIIPLPSRASQAKWRRMNRPAWRPRCRWAQAWQMQPRLRL